MRIHKLMPARLSGTPLTRGFLSAVTERRSAGAHRAGVVNSLVLIRGKKNNCKRRIGKTTAIKAEATAEGEM